MKTQGDGVHLYHSREASGEVLLYRPGRSGTHHGLVQLRLQAGVMLGLKPAFSHLSLGL